MPSTIFSAIPLVGSSIDSTIGMVPGGQSLQQGLNYVPGTGIAKTALNTATGVAAGATAGAVIGTAVGAKEGFNTKGGTGKRKQKTKRNKRKMRKTMRKMRKTRYLKLEKV
jgi:hypothetical protein